MSDATQAETVEAEIEAESRMMQHAKVDEFRRLHWDYLAARAAYHDPDVAEDDKHMNALHAKQDAAERALLVQPSPVTWGIWVKWEILDRLVTTDAEDGHLAENRIIIALGAIKADIIRFGLANG